MQLAITCPKCGLESHNPNDVREGYCAWCHDYTSVDKQQRNLLAEGWAAGYTSSVMAGVREAFPAKEMQRQCIRNLARTLLAVIGDTARTPLEEEEEGAGRWIASLTERFKQS